MFRITITYWMRGTECITVESLECIASLDTRQVQAVSIESTGGD